MTERGRLGRPRYRKSTVAVLTLLAACSGDSCNEETLGIDPESNVFVSVSLAGDGDGRVEVSSGQLWSCSIAVGEVRASGADVTQSANRCSWETYDAGAGGSIAFHAVPGSGSVFAGWSDECTGADVDCSVEWLSGGANVSVGAEFLFSPSGVTVTVADPELEPGMTSGASADHQSSRVLQGLQYTWTSSDPAVASISGTGGQATITALSAGTTQITARTRGITSNEVAVIVVEPQPGPGVLEGILYDVDGFTPLDSVFLSGGPVEGSQGDALRGRTGRQNPLDPGVIPPGGYRFEAAGGRYAMFSVAVLGKRYLSTPGDTADVFAGRTTPLDLFVAHGYGLDMLQTDVGTIQATPGATTIVTVDYRAWNRDLCPGCVPALGIGVDSTALAVYRFGIPGIYPGKQETGVAIPITVPDHGGTIYATLITTSTGAGIEPGLQQYRDRWAANVQGTTMIAIGTLVVN